MKVICQINSVINSGSTGRIAEEIGQTAIANGWESYIAFGRNDRFSQSHKIKIGNDWDIQWHGLNTRLFDKHGLASKKATENFIRQIEKIRPDIIHLHNIHGYYLNIEILFNYLAKIDIPIVWTLHDCWSFTGHCTHFDFINCEKWENLCYSCPQKRMYPSSLFLDRSKINYLIKKKLFTSIKKMVIIPVSKWLEQIVEKSYLKNYPKQIIYNGIDTTIFSPQDTIHLQRKYDLINQFILIGVANIWDKRKGLNDFIELSKNINKDEKIILIGLTEKQIKDLPQNIIGISRTEDVQQLAELYSLANVFLNPTWEDNFPTTNIEALACGTPVITYRTGGSPEAITPDTGFIIDKGDLLNLRKAIDTIKSKGKDSYTDACRLRVETMFNKNDRYNEYIQLYENLL